MPSLYLILFSLYWAQGLPVGFMTHALPVILRSEGLSLAQIGGFGLLMLPWSIKILWAPLIDRYASYRTWIMPLQLGTILGVVLLAFLPLQHVHQPLYLMLFFLVLLWINLAAATQDIATDGLAVTQLKTQAQHWGNSLQVLGSRLGFIVGGGGVLWLLEVWHWQSTFLLLAALVFLNSLPILLQRQTVVPVQATAQQNVVNFNSYLRYFKSSPELWTWLGVLLSFKVADGLAGPLLKPLMVDLGLSFQQIGLYITILGAVMALLGAGLAGVLLKFISRVQALLLFSGLKILSLLGYVWLALQYEQHSLIQPWLIYSINAFEDFSSSMLLVVMLTLIMHYSRKTWAATDFTLQVAIMATVSGGLYMVSGVLADALGYTNYLVIIVLIATVALYPIYRWQKHFNA